VLHLTSVPLRVAIQVWICGFDVVVERNALGYQEKKDPKSESHHLFDHFPHSIVSEHHH
jgi:hypothetical protein